MPPFFWPLLSTKNQRDLKRLRPYVEKINALEKQMKALDDQQLQAHTLKFKEKIREGAPLEDLIVESFAVVREASWRVLGLRPFDVQLMGAVVLFQGKIAEMKTGEGKTLTATMALYLHGLTGQGAHLVTVNDYLATRDARDMGQLFQWLGLSVGCITNDLDDQQRKAQYACDITYGTNNEFAFDYLRDNMKFELNDYVQRKHNFCIVDEVDSILIDEARTPLLISGPQERTNHQLYERANSIIPKLTMAKDFTVDEKSHSAIFTEEGILKVQKILGVDDLYRVDNSELLHHLNQALKAHHLFKPEVNYVVKDGRVIIVDEFTGRLKEGSRWSDGLHQAVEAKEGVPIKSENQTLASITFQNYFKLYNRLSGMTGTADTEAEEFSKIYSLDVVVIPTNVAVIRTDFPDLIYKTRHEKIQAIGQLIKELFEKGQPVLVGTISIESSEIISRSLKAMRVPHEVLNAKQHEREAQIIAKAGDLGSVTIATNMAGRGTDIKLTEETRNLGGLYIVGTERHESRRIDNQLRGRSGRQGDPGQSKFFISLEDDLMRIFGSDRIKKIMTTMGMKDDEPIEHKMITNAIAKAQKKVETHNFEIRKHLLEYDNVMNEQRRVIYRIRREILSDQDNMGLIEEMIEDITEVPDDEQASESKALEMKKSLQEKFSSYDPQQVQMAIRELLLSTFDQHWKNHLLAMDHLKEGINLRVYAQKDPLNEYKRESFFLFSKMKEVIKQSVLKNAFDMRLYTQEEMEILKQRQKEFFEAQMQAHKTSERAKSQASSTERSSKKVGRNSPCPCGSGKKFKHCHGR